MKHLRHFFVLLFFSRLQPKERWKKKKLKRQVDDTNVAQLTTLNICFCILDKNDCFSISQHINSVVNKRFNMHETASTVTGHLENYSLSHWARKMKVKWGITYLKKKKKCARGKMKSTGLRDKVGGMWRTRGRGGGWAGMVRDVHREWEQRVSWHWYFPLY